MAGSGGAETFPAGMSECLHLFCQTSFLTNQLILLRRGGERHQAVDFREPRGDVPCNQCIDAPVDDFFRPIQTSRFPEQLFELADGLLVFQVLENVTRRRVRAKIRYTEVRKEPSGAIRRS